MLKRIEESQRTKELGKVLEHHERKVLVFLLYSYYESSTLQSAL
jgi:hypothetical protein